MPIWPEFGFWLEISSQLAALNLDENNFITKHWLQCHQDDLVPPEFTFMVDTIHKDPLSREIDEAIKIHECEAEFSTLNSKSEWNGTTLSRLCIEKSSRVRKKETIDDMKKEAQNKEARYCSKAQLEKLITETTVLRAPNV